MNMRFKRKHKLFIYQILIKLVVGKCMIVNFNKGLKK